jgi:hypothetical protein
MRSHKRKVMKVIMQDNEHPLAVVAKHQETAPVSVSAIALELGIPIIPMPLGSGIAGQLKREISPAGLPRFKIPVNSETPVNRQRFTIAHELAHYILHRDLIEGGIVDDVMYRSTLGGPYETQANQLASDILMPIRLIKKYRQLNPTSDWNELARAFAVSPEAMKIHLKNIRFSSDLPDEA